MQCRKGHAKDVGDDRGIAKTDNMQQHRMTLRGNPTQYVIAIL
jgi:hypothetical protein